MGTNQYSTINTNIVLAYIIINKSYLGIVTRKSLREITCLHGIPNFASMIIPCPHYVSTHFYPSAHLHAHLCVHCSIIIIIINTNNNNNNSDNNIMAQG